jgi:hypothetical protein
MGWFALGLAAAMAAFFVAFQFLPGAWCEPLSVRVMAGLFIVLTAAFYLRLVDTDRGAKPGALHRMLVGGSAGLVVAAIAAGSGELHAALAIIGALLGLGGMRWIDHLRL